MINSFLVGVLCSVLVTALVGIQPLLATGAGVIAFVIALVAHYRLGMRLDQQVREHSDYRFSPPVD